MAEIRWVGHNCIRIRTKDAMILIDPLGKSTGYSLPKQTADIVIISHDHPGHSNLDAVRPEYHLVDGPGEYEMNDVFITGVRTYHDDARGEKRGKNTSYLIEAEGIAFCHLGDLGHTLNSHQAEALAQTDILMIPAGGGDVLSPAQAAEVVTQLEPKIIIPMQFATGGGDRSLGSIEEFAKALGTPVPEAEDKLPIKSSELSDGMEVRFVVLKPEGEVSR